MNFRRIIVSAMIALPFIVCVPQAQSDDTLKVRTMNLNLIPLKYATSNFQTLADSTGIYIKVVTPISIAELEKLLRAIETWLEYNRVFRP
jgi:hypothetical protein